MRDFIVYEHIIGLPDFLDEDVTDEIWEEMHYIFDTFEEEKEVENFVEGINRIASTDMRNRPRNLYVFWID